MYIASFGVLAYSNIWSTYTGLRCQKCMLPRLRVFCWLFKIWS